jgi:hypothetical protein
MACRSLLLTPLLAALVWPGASLAAPPADDQADRLLFLLEYVGADYALAVGRGKVIDPFEYAEMTRFSRHLVERAHVLVERGAPAGTRDELLAAAPGRARARAGPG